MAIPKTACAAVLTAFNKDLELKTDHPVKQPSELAPGECLIKIEYAGLCHSDLHIKKGDWKVKAPIPLVAGHEGVGTVVAIGEHTSPNSTIKVGDRVGCKWIGNSCLRCEMCRRGLDLCCPVASSSIHGFMIDGTFAEYVVSYVDYVTPIPEGIDSAAATPILCAGVTIFTAIRTSNAKIGDWIVISGAGGGLGHLGVQYAAAMGLRVLAIDAGEEKKNLCLKLGAEKWIDFKESGDKLVEDVQKAAGGVGPHAAVIAVGDSRPFNSALMYLRPAGTLVCVGVPGGAGLMQVPIGLVIGKSLTIVGSAVGNRQDAIDALDVAASGKVKVHYEVKPLEDVNQLMDDMEAGKITGRTILKID